MIFSTASARLPGIVAITLFGVLATCLSVASAAEPNVASRSVKFADLDLSSPSGAQVLYRRIRAAARVTCSHYFLVTDSDKDRCVRDATADAVHRANVSGFPVPKDGKALPQTAH
jgi:UrcA family protein